MDGSLEMLIDAKGQSIDLMTSQEFSTEILEEPTVNI